MKLISITLAHDNQDIISDTLRTVVDTVDVCLIIDNGCTDNTIKEAESVVGSKLHVVEFLWDDCSTARNFAFKQAAELGGDWAVILDSDERLQLPVDARKQLEQSSAVVFKVKHRDKFYPKSRFFRLPVTGEFQGRSHEFYTVVSNTWMVGATFTELGKTPEQNKAKFERVVELLSKQVEETPLEPRWWFYLADGYHGLGNIEEAIRCFRRCAELPGWGEQRAWACYRAASCLVIAGRPEEAIPMCAYGLVWHAGIAELCWMAARASWLIGNMRQAKYWALLAKPLGAYPGKYDETGRTLFHHVPALYEGPYDVLRFALKTLGEETAAKEAEMMFQQAKAARISATS